jgi:hypothetical protein
VAADALIPVPPLQVRMELADGSDATPVRVFRARFQGEDDLFAAIVKDSVTTLPYRLEVHDVALATGTVPQIEFRAEKRTVAIPPLSIFRDPHDYGSHHTLFVRVGTDDAVHRISMRGNRTTAEATSVSAALRKIPSILYGPEPDLLKSPDHERQARYDALENFYESVEWSRSSVVSVLHSSRSKERDRVYLRVSAKRLDR